MRKCITIVLTLMLLAGLYTTAAAAPEELTVSNASVQTGQTVFLSVTLNTSVTADSVALTYSYDKAMLKPIPGSCQWSVKGDLDNFNNKNAGVWAVSSAKDLKGEICLLAFQALEDAELDDTKVSVTVSAKKNGQTVGSYDAKGTVSVTCSHTFGAWSPKDVSTHSRQCIACKETETGTHTWDDGVLSQNPQDAATQLKTFTCQLCGGTNAIVVEGSYQQTDATQQTQPPQTQVPVETMPTTLPQSETRPVYTPPEPSEVTYNEQTIPSYEDTHEETTQPYKDYNAPDHTHAAQEGTDPLYIPVTGENVTEEQDHDHDHITGQTGGINWVTALVVIAAAAVIIGGAVFFVKKKK